MGNQSEHGRKPRVLVITRNFPPAVGGIERYVAEIVGQLVGYWHVALCGPKGCGAFASGVVAVRESRLKPLPWFLASSFVQSLAVARTFKPDLVIASSGLMAPQALLLARMLKVPVAVFVYGLDLVVENALYRAVWLPAIRRCDGVIPISRRTRDLALARGVAAARLCSIIHPGTPPVTPDPGGGLEFRRRHGLTGRRILLSVGRMVPRKGLIPFIENCLPRIVAADPSVTLVVIGGEPVDSLKGDGGGVGGRALAAAQAHGIAAHVMLLGQVDDSELAGAWNAADVHIFPGLELPGDVEGFGIVCIEAAAHGVPTAAFDVGGVGDAVSDESGALVEGGDYARLAGAIVQFLADDPQLAARRASARAFSAEFAWPLIGAKARAVLDALVDR